MAERNQISGDGECDPSGDQSDLHRHRHLGLLVFFLLGLCIGSLLTLVGLTLGHQLDWQNSTL